MTWTALQWHRRLWSSGDLIFRHISTVHSPKSRSRCHCHRAGSGSLVVPRGLLSADISASMSLGISQKESDIKVRTASIARQSSVIVGLRFHGLGGCVLVQIETSPRIHFQFARYELSRTNGPACHRTERKRYCQLWG